MKTSPLAVLAAVAVLGLAACAPTVEPAPEASAEVEFVLSSPDLDAEGYLPEWAVGNAEGFCDGENRSPQLDWTGAPDGTAAYAVTMTDPNFPSYVHWVVSDIPGDTESLASAPDGQVETGVVGRGGGGVGTYTGPCVVDNSYLYTVYALDEPVIGDSGTTLIDLSGLMADHVLATAELEIKRH